MQAKQWTVQIYISEDDGDERTQARAVLYARDSKWHESVGVARRNPGDRPVPEIGDELAAGRALMDLADKLIGDAVDDVARLGGPIDAR
ncbi:DUF1876 domain-containing protein [Nonomuraea muscovyensis]|jgi:hypothetical protein|uniref:DUF1876 domain-containing protein n=1 Tax=Nonomuraea muscovyensis TaxID=1124761 RepID=A0A7X0C3P3_9ACTN|nr:DUF1876 domain-containing protein [Nonomuraea muscovyensis]MBB6346139.1 hypothetical protein [Nonomuraea muscovyensis]MDF2710207.1 hypothetical protein [Nonomuraea muscovyensis]